jgi:hypothetical protein
MTSEDGNKAARGLGETTLEITVALGMMALGLLVIYDSLRLGMRWADDGPQPGYFPFYIGLLLTVSCGLVVLRALMRGRNGRLFAEYAHLRSISALLLPFAVFIVAIYGLGIYVAAALFIAYCMRRMGAHGWGLVVAVALPTVAILFLLFEVWFKLPLVKGPLEAALGFA